MNVFKHAYIGESLETYLDCFEHRSWEESVFLSHKDDRSDWDPLILSQFDITRIEKAGKALGASKLINIKNSLKAFNVEILFNSKSLILGNSFSQNEFKRMRCNISDFSFLEKMGLLKRSELDLEFFIVSRKKLLEIFELELKRNNGYLFKGNIQNISFTKKSFNFLELDSFWGKVEALEYVVDSNLRLKKLVYGNMSYHQKVISSFVFEINNLKKFRNLVLSKESFQGSFVHLGAFFYSLDDKFFCKVYFFNDETISFERKHDLAVNYLNIVKKEVLSLLDFCFEIKKFQGERIQTNTVIKNTFKNVRTLH